MRSLIWRWEAFAKKRQIKNHAKLTSYTVPHIRINQYKPGLHTWPDTSQQKEWNVQNILKWRCACLNQ